MHFENIFQEFLLLFIPAVARKVTEKDRQNQIVKAIDDLSDNETQILLVGDPSQIAALQVGWRIWGTTRARYICVLCITMSVACSQKIELNGGFDEPGIDASFEELNIKIEDIELGWN